MKSRAIDEIIIFRVAVADKALGFSYCGLSDP